MDFEAFQHSVKQDTPPPGADIYLQAMWQDAHGNWNKAHSLVDHLDDVMASWVHAYLHRKEGDTWNADYWYKKAGKKRPDVSLKQEWENIVKALL